MCVHTQFNRQRCRLRNVDRSKGEYYADQLSISRRMSMPFGVSRTHVCDTCPIVTHLIANLLRCDKSCKTRITHVCGVDVALCVRTLCKRVLALNACIHFTYMLMCVSYRAYARRRDVDNDMLR